MTKILMRFIILTLLLVGVNSFCHSQSSFIHLKSGEYQVKSSFTNSIRLLNFSEKELIGEYHFKLISFKSIPTIKHIIELEENGIKLLKYLPENTFYAAIHKTANLSSIGNSAFIGEIFPHYKLSKDLFEKSYHDWAIDEKDQIKLNIIYYEIIEDSIINNLLSSLNIKILFNSKSHTIQVQLPIDQLSELYKQNAFYYFEQIEPPSKMDNLVGVTNNRSNTLNTEYSSGLKQDGSNITILLQDNSILNNHIDFTGRFFNASSAVQSGDHGEHCGGIIAGAGNIDPITRGMAPNAKVLVYNFDNSNYYSVPGLYTSDDLTITSKSYGNGINGGYTSLTSDLDEQVYDFPSLIHVFSAGNSNGNGTTAAGSQWFNITGGHKTGKNVIAVGNLSNLDVISNSSSRGPSKDGRIKPDICAVGSSVYSTVEPQNYTVKSGTSMACPAIAGIIAQIYQGYKEDHSNTNPPSGLIKAALLNTADDLGNIGPDYIYGWGRVNARRANNLIEENNYFTGSMTQGNSITHGLYLNVNTSKIKIMLYWTDEEGSPSASSALVNDLDLVITGPNGQTHLPWLLNNNTNSASLNTSAFNGADHVNNMEQVEINQAQSGVYQIEVSGFSVPSGIQEYFIVYEFINSDVSLTYPIGGESFDPLKNEVIRWDANGVGAVFNLEYSIDAGTSWITLVSNLDPSARHYNWNIPDIITGNAIVRITRGSSQSQSHAPFSIINIPTNLDVRAVCPSFMVVSWNTVSGATGYETSLLGDFTMDSVGYTTDTSMVINFIPGAPIWWSVKALAGNNCTGRRAIAQYHSGSILNCVVNRDVALQSNSDLDGSELTSCMFDNDFLININIINTGLTPIANIPIKCQLNNQPILSSIYIDTILPDSSANFIFPSTITPLIGANSLNIWSELSFDGNNFNDTIISSFNYSSGFSQPIPWVENFESFNLCSTSSNCENEVCQMSNGFSNELNGIKDDIDWRVNSGSTPTSTTGPTQDYQPGNSNGKYLYLEASGNPQCINNQANLISPCVDLTNVENAFLRFAYHMNGGDMGALHVDIFSDGTWNLDTTPFISGNQGNSWKTRDVSLTPYLGKTITFRFRGITGNGFESDLAIDAISIEGVASVSKQNNGFEIYPNPTTSFISIKSINSIKNTSIEIRNMNGQIVYQEKMSSQYQTIDMHELAKGIYIVAIKTEDSIQIKRIVKQ